MKCIPLLRESRMSWMKQMYFLRLVCSRSRGCSHVRGMCHVTDTRDVQQTQADSRIVQQAQSDVTERVRVGRNVGRIQGEQYQRVLMSPDQPPDPRFLKVAIIGAPNAGKSTLVNRLLGWKVNAVSSKVHTTRKNTNTFFTEENTQIAFVDTPGVMTAGHRRKHYCEGRMATDPEESVNDADLVGVIVDVSDKWTRNNLHVEILKVLHLHPQVASFLILNKVDGLKKKTILLETTRRLSKGVVGGQKIQVSSKMNHKPNQPIGNFGNLFSKLEKQYGPLKDANVTKPENSNPENYQDMWLKHFASEINKDAVISNTLQKNKAMENTDTTSEADESVLNPLKADETSSDIDMANSINAVGEADVAVSELSYQSEFLKRIQSQSASDILCKSRSTEEDDTDTDWTVKASLIEDAKLAAKQEHGWPKFDRVFLVSALNGDGINDIKDYLVSCAKCEPWMYHSSLVTDQDPHDLARMCVWQSVLEFTPGSIPYRVEPEVTYWHVDENNQLNIIMTLNMSSTWEIKQMIGPQGKNIGFITRQSKQALMDAFQCEVRFKIVVVLRKKKR